MFTNIVSGIISGIVILLVEYLFFQRKNNHQETPLVNDTKAKNIPASQQPIHINLSQEIPQTIITQASPLSQNTKKPVLAAILSFMWGGAGQIYLGQTKKGIALIVIMLITSFVALGFFVTVLSSIDAYRIAKKINNGNYVGEWEFGINWSSVIIALFVNIGLYVLLYMASQ